MKKILKEGKYEKSILKFVCDKCKTEFESNEYILIGIPVYGNVSICPVCESGVIEDKQ